MKKDNNNFLNDNLEKESSGENYKQKDFLSKHLSNYKSNDNFAVVWTLKALLISIVFLGIVYLVSYLQKNPYAFSIPDTSYLMKNSGIKSKLMSLGGTKNILLLGVDSNGSKTDPFKATRSDTIIIFSVDRYGKSANAISIPRDSKVYISDGHGINKINAAHALGGPELTIKTIEDTFGIEINNYIVINYNAVKDFVKEIGGVKLNVEKRMYYNDNAAGLHINLRPGQQVLNAEQAEGYLRFRHDALGDIGRIKRQQWFLRALVEKLKSPDTILKLPRLLEITGRNLKTNMNIYDLSKLVNLLKNIKLENMQVASLPGKPNKYGEVSYWILDAEQAQCIIDKLVYRESSKSAELLTVSLVYSSKYKNRINEIKNILNEMGYEVKYTTLDDSPHTKIVAHSNIASLKNISKIRNQISELKNAQFIIEPDSYLYPSTDYTIVLAD